LFSLLLGSATPGGSIGHSTPTSHKSAVPGRYHRHPGLVDQFHQPLPGPSFREVEPIPYFKDALLDIGYATFTTGMQAEIIRRGTSSRAVEGGRALSLAASLYAHHLGLDVAGLRSAKVNQWPGGIELDRNLLINFGGPPNAVYRQGNLSGGFNICPSHLVAAGVYPEDFFKDKIVLVGTGLSDAPDHWELGGKTMDLTVVFADLEGFTPLSMERWRSTSCCRVRL